MMGQSIADIFSFTSILLTGFTGLVGKCLVWKLLTSCPDLKNIYVLVRGNKKIPDPKRRFEDLLNSFPLSELDQSVKNKIVLLEGDLSVNFENFNGLIAQIDIVVHAASSVNFEESINTSIEANVVGCKNLLDFCLTTLKPKLFVYISTAYAHCDQGDYLTEKISTVEQSPDDVINAFRWMTTEMGGAISPLLVKDKPNSYVYSKALAENYILSQSESSPFPIAVVRPTIIGAAYQEPHPGFIDNLNAITGAISAGAYGIWKMTSFDANIIFDCIPVDFCVNGIISTCAYCLNNSQPFKSPFVVHLATSTEKPCSWSLWPTLQKRARAESPMENSIRYPHVMQVSPFMEKIFKVVYVNFFVVFYDLLLKMSGNKFRLSRINRKMDRMFKLTTYFIQKQWSWEQTSFTKVKGFQTELDQNDIFSLDYSVLKWDDYYISYYKGVKKFLFKEATSDLSRARKRQKILAFMYYIGEPLLLLLFCVVLYLPFHVAYKVLF